MTISANKYDPINYIIFSQGLKIKTVRIEGAVLIISLTSGQDLLVSVRKNEKLKNASSKQLKNFRLIGKGTGIHWPDLDEDLSLYGFLKSYLTQNLQKKKKLSIA